MNITLLKKMSREVSVPILGGLLADYTQTIASADEVDADLLEVITAVDVIIAELKSRGGSAGTTQKRKPRTKPQAPVITPQPAANTHVIATIGGGERERE